MTATEIIDKLKTVLLSAEPKQEEVIKEEVKEVELAEEVKAEPKQEEAAPMEAAPQIDTDKFATKEELASELAGIKAILKQLSEIINPTEEKDVPAELSAEVVEEKVELAEEAKEIVHSPEAEVEETKKVLFSQKRVKGTKDLIYNKLFNK
tara:strand:- start:113 stop:565 length:453 start_codon:yes stop_codon:yes gene_type:complete